MTLIELLHSLNRTNLNITAMVQSRLTTPSFSRATVAPNLHHQTTDAKREYPYTSKMQESLLLWTFSHCP
jgi:hypothetical protein